MNCDTAVSRKPKRNLNNSSVQEILEKYQRDNRTGEWIGANDSSIRMWCKDNGGWIRWLKRVGVKHKIKWNEKKVIKVFNANKEKDRNWFKDHEEYNTIIGWTSRNGCWKKWAKKGELINYNRSRTPENVFEFLTENRNKTPMWVITEHNAIYKWCTRNGGFPSWAKKVGMII